VHLVSVATPPAFTGDAMPASDPEMDIAVAGGAPSAHLARARFFLGNAR
jgi:hypothetical protein